MRILFLFACLSWISTAQSTPLGELAGQISLAWQASRRPVVVLGEASHQDPTSPALLKELILREAFDIGFIAIDVDRDQFLAVEILVKDINRARRNAGLAPLGLIDLDVTRAPWYSRAPLPEVGLKEREVRGLRGIVYSQASHGAGGITGVPRMASSGVTMYYEFKSLENLYSSPRVLRVYLNTRRSMSEQLFAALSFEYINSHSALAQILNPIPGSLISTQTEEFRELERQAMDNGRDAISKNFDYWAQLEGLSCEDILNPL